jgi:hypothetical protein
MTHTATTLELIKQEFLEAESEFSARSFSDRSPSHKAAAKIMDMERQKHNQGIKTNHHLNFIRNIIESNIDELTKS